MKNSKCIRLLKSLKQIDFYRFGIFLNSPFCNKNKTLCNLNNILNKYYPELDNDAIKKENIYKVLFPKKIYKEKTIYNLDSELEKLLEKFMGCLNYRNNENSGNEVNNLLEELRCSFYKNNLKINESIFKQKINELTKELDNIKNMDKDYFYTKYKLQKIINQFYMNHPDKNNYVNLTAELYYFDKYSILTKVEQEFRLLSENNEMSKTIGMNLPKIFKDLDREYVYEYIKYS